jgi:hypothetical protein
VRVICPDAWFLAPGVGAQGADLKTALTAGLRADKKGILVPVSRAVIAAASPRKAAEQLREQINTVVADISPGPHDPFRALVNGLFSTGCVKFGSFTLALANNRRFTSTCAVSSLTGCAGPGSRSLH